MTSAALRLNLLTRRRIRGCYVTHRPRQRRLWIAYPYRWRKA